MKLNYVVVKYVLFDVFLLLFYQVIHIILSCCLRDFVFEEIKHIPLFVTKCT